MSDFMQDWFSLWLAFTIGCAPFSTFFGLSSQVFGKDKVPAGCLIVALLLLIGGIPLGIWCYHTFAVVYRP